MGRPGKLFDQDEGLGEAAGAPREERRLGAFFDQDAAYVDDALEAQDRDPLPSWPEPASPDPSGQPILRITSSPFARPAPSGAARPAPTGAARPPAPAVPEAPPRSGRRTAPARAGAPPAADFRWPSDADAGPGRTAAPVPRPPAPPSAPPPPAPRPSAPPPAAPSPAVPRPSAAPPSAPSPAAPSPAVPRPSAAPPSAAPPSAAPPSAAPPSAAPPSAAPGPAPPPAAPARPVRPQPAPRRPARRATAPAPASLASSSAVMAAGTLLSRLTGFARVLLVATVLGTSGLGDAYNLANSVPNIVYDLLLGGILSATLVPVFVAELGRRDEEEGQRAISAVVTAIGVALVAVSALLYLLAPAVLRFYLVLNHTSGKAAEQAVGASLLHLFAPQVLLLGAIVVSTALLNARRRFAAAAFSPVVNNLIAIAALVATRVTATNLQVGPFRHEHGPLLVLGVGTTLGYLVQLVVQWPAQRRAGIVIRPVWAPHHPAVRRVAGLSAWLVGTVVANQIAFNVILVYAARRQGDVTVYTTAYQFFQLPYALFTVSVASTLTPDLAERWARRDTVGFQRRIIQGVRVTLGILLPAAAGYAIIAQPLIDLGVLYGHVSPGKAHEMGVSLTVFSLGLPGFSAFALLMRAYQAMPDARTMFSMYVVENALTLVAAVILYPALGVEGLALAFVAPYTVVAVLAARRLRRRIGTLGGSLTVRALARISLATAAMAGGLLALQTALPAGRSHVALAVRLAADLTVGTALYVGVARLLGIEEVEPVLGLLRRGRRAPGPPRPV